MSPVKTRPAKRTSQMIETNQGAAGHAKLLDAARHAVTATAQSGAPYVSANELAKYREILSEASISRSPEPIPNLYPWHAAAAIEKLADFALGLTREQDREPPAFVRILTGSCHNFFYGREVTKKLLTFAIEGGQIRVLIWNNHFNEEQCDLLKFTKLLDLDESVQFRFSNIPGIPGLSHFMVVDEIAYRWEAEHHCEREDGSFSDFDPTVPARICFNDQQRAKSLVNIFDVAWNLFKPLNASPIAPSPAAK